MARKRPFGICCICGKLEKMSYEHVPPRSAFNDCPAVMTPALKLINVPPLEYGNQNGEIRQRGIGEYTLCEPCNNRTGQWYGTAYAWWARQGLEWLKVVDRPTRLYFPFRIFPLRVIKQIVCMLFSVRGARLRKHHPELVKFVLDPRQKYLHPDIHIYAYLNLGNHGRYMGGAVKFELNEDDVNMGTLDDMVSEANRLWSKGRVMSEIGCRPIGYLVSYDSTPPDARLVDISYFASYGYYDWQPLALNLPALPVWTYFPGDYRPLEQIERDAERNTISLNNEN